jgi:hypothetical protein
MTSIPSILSESGFVTSSDITETKISSILNGHFAPIRQNKHLKNPIEITKEQCEKMNITGRMSCIPISSFPYQYDEFEDHLNGWYMIRLNCISDEHDIDIYTCIFFTSGRVTAFTKPV